MSEAPKMIWATEQAGGDTRRFGIWDNIEEDVVAGSEKYHHDDTVTALQAKVARLEAALATYADPCDAQEEGDGSCGYEGNMCCKVARKALEKPND